MGLTNPSRALERSVLRSTSLRLLTLSGVPLFFINLFRPTSLLALNLFFLIGALGWFFKITEVAPFESVEEFRKYPFLALCFSLFSIIFMRFHLLPSADLFMLTAWPSGLSSLRSLLLWRLHQELWFDWSNNFKTGVFFSIRANMRSPFSVDLYQANLQLHLFLFNSSLCLTLTPIFWGHLPPHSFFFQTCIFAEGQLFHLSQDLMRYPCFLMGPFWGMPLSFVQSFYSAPSHLRFTQIVSFTSALPTLPSLNAITGCLASFPIPLLLFEAQLPPFESPWLISLCHVMSGSLFSNLLPHFRFGQTWSKSRLSKSFWKLLDPLTCSCFLLLLLGRFSLHDLSLSSVELTCRSVWSWLFPLYAPTLTPFFVAKVSLSLTLTLFHFTRSGDLDYWLCSFPFGKNGSSFLANCSLCGTETTLFFSAGPFGLSFFTEAAPFCKLSAGLDRTNNYKSAITLLLLSNSRSFLNTLSSPFLLPQSFWHI